MSAVAPEIPTELSGAIGHARENTFRFAEEPMTDRGQFIRGYTHDAGPALIHPGF